MTTPSTIEVPAVSGTNATSTIPPTLLTDAVALRPAPARKPTPRVQTPVQAKQPVNPPVAPVPQRQPIFVEIGITEPTREQIRERAYQVYLGRSGNPGSAESDWLLAEAQLRAEARKRMGCS